MADLDDSSFTFGANRPGGADAESVWHGVSQLADPLGIGGEGGHGGTNIWSKISGAYNPEQVNIGGFGKDPTSVDARAWSTTGPNGAPQSEGRVGQMTLIQQLQDQAAGRGPSLAQMQLQKGTDRNIAQAMALGASQRGAGQAGMLKGIQGQQAGIAQGMAGDAAMLRMQEQMQARQMLGQNLGQVRGQDQGFAGMVEQSNQFNQGQQTQNSQFNAGQANMLANSAAERAQQRAIEQAKLDQEREKLRAEAASKNSPTGMIGGILSAFSDERLKTDIQPGEGKIYEMLEGLGAHEYCYKDSKHGEGRRVSPMAQELEKSELGRDFVRETGEGKVVDYGKGFGTMLAAQAALHKRLKKLEG